MEIKPLIVKLGKIADLGALGSIWSLGKLALLLMLLFILGSWLPEMTPGFISDYFNKGEGGIVIVDSPEVYSRERLINDRFRQASWLEDELRQSPKRQFGNQAISDMHQILGLSNNIGNTKAGEQGEEMPNSSSDGAAEDGDRSNDKRNPGTTVSPTERFRDIRAYREEIRTEMMETLLDDRHDIKGNTLYRLKFDTTVLPEENTEKLVVIQARLSRADFCKPGTASYPRHLTQSKHRPCISIQAIHDSWLTQTEEKINAAIEGTIRSLRRRSLSTAEFSELVRFLQAKVSKTSDTNSSELPKLKKLTEKEIDVAKAAKVKAQQQAKRLNFLTTNIDSLTSLRKFNPQCLEQSKRLPPIKESDRTQSNSLMDDAEPYWWQKTRETCPEESASNFFLFNRSVNEETKARYNKLRKLLLRHYVENMVHGMAFQELEGIHAEYAGSEHDMNKHNEYFKTLDTISRIEIAEQNLLRFATVGMWVDKYTYSNTERLKNCKKLYDHKLEAFGPKALSCIAHLEKTNCDDIDFCTVRVEPKVPEPRQKIICDDSVQLADHHLWCKVRKVFEQLLEINETYYSYAVTPKESAQRVLTIASERRQKQLALSLVASSANGMDEATINSITRAISDSSTKIEQIQRRPLVLSFGRGQPVLVDDISDVGSGIDFGWIIGPKYLFSGKGDGKIKFYHSPTQNSLSAMISVPSWWTAVNLQIDTCWIDQNDIPSTLKTSVKGLNSLEDRHHIKNLCDNTAAGEKHNVDVDYLVRLPGSAEELPRKFGYEIERVPAIAHSGILANFYVGQKNASLIIRGNELWRSTVVTMGHQKADSIEVLPNMKGIIATFNTIGIPSVKMVPGRQQGDEENCSVESEVVVWTSEGRTPEHQLLAMIHANPLLGPDLKNAKAEIYPEGFGGCSFPKSSQKVVTPPENPSDVTNNSWRKKTTPHQIWVKRSRGEEAIEGETGSRSDLNSQLSEK